jgi:PIN domain nuclease of toxin-antitoxin system
VNLLIDAHALIWGYFDPNQLSAKARSEITNVNNRVFVSPATHWEIAIKMSTGKLKLAESFADFVQHAIFDNGFAILPIELRHTAELVALPYHHRDPFDRLIVAQAMVEKLPVVSADPVLDKYAIQRIW